jgi:hypothetical protein
MTFEALTKEAANKIHYGGLTVEQVVAELTSQGHCPQLSYFAAKGGAILLQPVPDYESPAKKAIAAKSKSALYPICDGDGHGCYYMGCANCEEGS